jgi:hypothetical protein
MTLPAFAVAAVHGVMDGDMHGTDLDDVLEGFEQHPEDVVNEPDRTLPLYLQRKLAGQCTRCGESAAVDSDLCKPHLDDRRKRSRRAMSAQRKRLRDKRKCVGCGVKSKAYRCRKCIAARKRTGVSKIASGVSNAEIWRVDPGTTWSRYRGKGRRGRLTKEEQAEEDKRDARFAIEEIEKFVRAVDVVISPTVQALPRIQRDAAKREAAQYLGTAGRFLDDLADKYGG